MREVVRKLDLSVSPEAFLELIFDTDGTFFRTYNRDVNKDEEAAVTPWAAGRRQCVFHMGVTVPPFVKALLGTDRLKVIDEQRCTRDADGGACILSAPSLQVPGGHKFRTESSLRVCPRPGGGCAIEAAVRCTCDVWGMQAVLEKVMVDQAEVTFDVFLRYATAFVDRALCGEPSSESWADCSDALDAIDDVMSWTARPRGALPPAGAGAAGAAHDAETPPEGLSTQGWVAHRVLRELSDLRVALDAAKHRDATTAARLSRIEGMLEAAQHRATRSTWVMLAAAVGAVGAVAVVRNPEAVSSAVGAIWGRR